MTLSMLALAFLAGLRARLKETQIGVASDPTSTPYICKSLIS
jgi:hypothetical protein